MCRLFGFRSLIKSKLHTSLVQGENALMHQSPNHPDGWGVAYYIHNAPHIIKSQSSAIEDQLFQKLSKIVTSQTVIAHLRKKTIGSHSILNTHPFQYGHWTFAHNGNIKDFDKHKDKLMALIPEDLKGHILGSTDSEVILMIILGRLHNKKQLNKTSKKSLVDACKGAVKDICNIIGELHDDDLGSPQENYLTFLISDGHLMLAHQGGKSLYFSTYKKRCDERDSCAFFSEECENKTKSGKVNHLIFSSEPINNENVWETMKMNQIVCIDEKMTIY